MTPLLTLRDATAGYDGRQVLHGLDLTFQAGEHVSVLGKSGSGKSTLLGLLYAQLAAQAALIPQAAALVRPLSVFHNVYMGRLDRHSTARNLRMLAGPAGSSSAPPWPARSKTAVPSSSATSPCPRWTRCRQPASSACCAPGTKP